MTCALPWRWTQVLPANPAALSGAVPALYRLAAAAARPNYCATRGPPFRAFCRSIILEVAERGHTCPFGVIFVTHGEACDAGRAGGARGSTTAPGRAEAAALPGRWVALPHQRPGDRRCQRIHGVHERAGVLPPGPGRVLGAAAAGAPRRVRDFRRELPQ